MGGKAKKSSKNSPTNRGVTGKLPIKMIDDCLACQKCIAGRAYIKTYLATRRMDKPFVGKGVPCTGKEER